MLDSRVVVRLARAFGPGVAALLVVGACASSREGLEPRYVAVHNALAAMGLAQVGPLQRGSLGQGREARVKVELAAECTTVIALGGAGIVDLDAELRDPDDKPVGHDITHDPEAVVRACVERPGTYTLVVKVAQGAGEFVTAAWTGGGAAVGTPRGVEATAAALGRGTCDSPIALGAGTVSGTTTRGVNENEGSCASSSSRELVYKLDVATRQRVTIEVDPRFDAVLYVRREDCTEGDAEVACNDDSGQQRASRVDEVLDPGAYYVFVDGYASESGGFQMSVALADVPSLAEICQRARPILPGTPVQGTMSGSFDHARASCGNGAKGPDAVYKLDIAQRSRVRLVEASGDFGPVLHVRRQCADEASEMMCSNTGMADDEAAVTGVFDPMPLMVFADGADRDASGGFSLLAELAPEQGVAGTQGDACADAFTLSPRSDRSVGGDTFFARDDFAGKCGGAGAADVVYRVDVPRRSRIGARFTHQEGQHLFVLTRTCGDRTSELACGSSLDEIVSPGTYFLVVDGATAVSTGRFTFDWRVREIAAQENACRAAPLLVEGQTVAGTTTGAGDKFMTSCGGREEAQTSPDRLFRLVLAKRTHVRLSLATPAWDGVLAVRKSCLDPPGSSSVRAAEAACNNNAEDVHHARVDATLDPGTYLVQVDGHGGANEGAFKLEYKVIRP
jgi:hypothetical protein